jgi:nucleotide-binding universal stress UspA family protein
LIPLEGSKRAEKILPHVEELASHGRGGLSKVFYGSVAAGLLHRVDRPLLIIRSRNAE